MAAATLEQRSGWATVWEGEVPAEPHHCRTHQPRTIVVPVVADGSAGASPARWRFDAVLRLGGSLARSRTECWCLAIWCPACRMRWTNR